MVINEWFPIDDHHEAHHHKSSGWEDRKDNQVQQSQNSPLVAQPPQINPQQQPQSELGDNKIRWDRALQQKPAQLESITHDLVPPTANQNNGGFVNFPSH